MSANWSVDNASVLAPWHHLRKPCQVPPQLLPRSNDSEDLAGFEDENGWHRFEANWEVPKKNITCVEIEEVDRCWFCSHVIPLWRQLSGPILPLSLFPRLPSKGVKASSQRLSWASRDSNGMVIATELLVKFTNLAPRKSSVNARSDASFCATKPSRLQVLLSMLHLVPPKQSNNCPLSILHLLMDMQEQKGRLQVVRSHHLKEPSYWKMRIETGPIFPKFRSNNKNIRNHNLRCQTPMLVFFQEVSA